MENDKRADLGGFRNLSMKELFEQTWAQKLRNYSIQRKVKDARLSPASVEKGFLAFLFP